MENFVREEPDDEEDEQDEGDDDNEEDDDATRSDRRVSSARFSIQIAGPHWSAEK